VKVGSIVTLCIEKDYYDDDKIWLQTRNPETSETEKSDVGSSQHPALNLVPLALLLVASICLVLLTAIIYVRSI
jgi:hypothetical protein